MPARKWKNINGVSQCRWPNCTKVSVTESDYGVPYCLPHFAVVQRNREYIKQVYEAGLLDKHKNSLTNSAA